MAPGGQALSTADGVALRFLNSGRAAGLKIEATHHNRFAAQRAAQSAISGMVDRTKVNPAEMDRQKRWLTGPWIEVVDPPSLPINPLGSVWFLGAMRAGVAVSLIAGLTLLYGGVRKRRALANSAA
jgi:hypothetical protein